MHEQTTSTTEPAATEPVTTDPATKDPVTKPDPDPPTESALQAQLGELTARLEDATQSLADARLRRAIDMALIRAGTIDLDACAALIDCDQPTNATAAAAQLKNARPHLFTPSVPRESIMSPRLPEAQLTSLADKARATGDRRSIIDYLRTRRARLAL